MKHLKLIAAAAAGIGALAISKKAKAATVAAAPAAAASSVAAFGGSATVTAAPAQSVNHDASVAAVVATTVKAAPVYLPKDGAVFGTGDVVAPAAGDWIVDGVAATGSPLMTPAAGWTAEQLTVDLPTDTVRRMWEAEHPGSLWPYGPTRPG